MHSFACQPLLINSKGLNKMYILSLLIPHFIFVSHTLFYNPIYYLVLYGYHIDKCATNICTNPFCPCNFYYMNMLIISDVVDDDMTGNA